MPEAVTGIAAATESLEHPEWLDERDRSLAAIDGSGFAPGEIFAGRYRIVSPLGRGAMGDVYRADDLKLGQPIALKLFVPSASTGDDALAREVRLARGIAHPNVCRVYDIGETDQWRYLSMEYVDGETLASLFHRVGRLSSEKALDVARQLTSGLAAAHLQAVLHRDLKPSNVMLDGRGRVRILDFGLAVQTDAGPTRHIAGTPAYMAPEQLTGDRISPQTDLYALGLVLYELFTGRRVFYAASIADRLASPVDERSLDLNGILDSRVRDIIRRCLAPDPRERPASAEHVAAGLPGGGALTSALAEGRVLSPEMLAAASDRAALRPVVGGLLLVSVVFGCLLVAWGGGRLSVPAEAVPKPPEVLAERAREMLAALGHSQAVDAAYWFERVISGSSTDIHFVYRQSPQYLVPQNFLHHVTSSDPPVDIAGMASVTLDARGTLLGLSRLVDTAGTRPPSPIDWSALFERAGISERDFVPVPVARRPLLPHDAVQAWTHRQRPTAPIEVTAAALAGMPVYFVTEKAGDAQPARRVLSSRRDAIGETLFWLLVMTLLTATALIARRNVRAGEGDVSGAWRLATVVMISGISSAMLQSHHTPNVVDELAGLLAVCGWSLLWAGFTWVAYISFEPYVRRLWPGTLVSWTRASRGYLRDPLVGRDVLVGVLGGLILTAAFLARVSLTGEAPHLWHVAPALDALRSTRHHLGIAVFAILDGLQFAVGTFFLLLVFRIGLRRTSLAILALVLLATTLAVPSASPWAVVHGVATALLVVGILMRVGLLAAAVALMCERLVTRLPITLHLDAWYFGSSLVVLLLVVGVAIFGLIVALKGRPSFGATILDS
jgi:hypothetical protein